MSTISEYLAMKMRGTPVAEIKKHRKELQSAGYEITDQNLESHFLAGGRLDEITQLLSLAKEAEKEISFSEACTIDLMTKARNESTLPCLERSLERRSFHFESFAIDEVPIIGITLEKERLSASIGFDYFYPISAFDIDESFSYLKNRLGAAISAEIHASENRMNLMQRLPEITTVLERVAIESLSTITNLKIEIKRA